MQSYLKRTAAVCLLTAMTVGNLTAQKVALKTNLLYWATTTPNIGMEVGLGKKHTAQLFYGLNPWKFSHSRAKQVRHWLLMPEYRYWFCQKFNGHFLGVHALGGEYNIGGIDIPNYVFSDLDSKRYEGWYAGGGVSYGYQWLLSKHWNLEASLGVGYIRFHYKESDCTKCARPDGTGNKNYFGPTKLALSLMYCF